MTTFNLRFFMRIMLLFVFFIFHQFFFAQTLPYTHVVKGVIRDADAKTSLVGAAVAILGTNMGTVSDENGYFRLENVPIGRYDLYVSFLGYESLLLNQIAVTTGKEVFLNIDLKEKVEQLKEVTATSQQHKSLPINEMASLSVRTFSLEESNRYAATFSDPARMAQNFAGVSTNNDLGNEIIVRGNSPRNVSWRLEGVEIPNPNHFGNLGSSGGGISMLSGTALGQSDFYTGAFPAEYGNALAGVFDLKMRNGNPDKREYSAQLGLIGAELNAEGYFQKGKKASYLLHYRYTTAGLVLPFLPQEFAAYIPKYQDFSAKLHLPTPRWGTFSFFALGGDNLSQREAVADSTQWRDDSQADENFREYNRAGIVGISHLFFFNKNKMYLKSVIAATNLLGKVDNSRLDPQQNYALVPVYASDMNTNDIKCNIFLNYKLSASNTLRIGGAFTHTSYRLKYKSYRVPTRDWYVPFDNSGSTGFYQLYAQNKHRLNAQWTLHTGVHFAQWLLNQSASLEPRLSVQYQPNVQTTWGFSLGQHSRPEHISVYMLEYVDAQGRKTTPNRGLKMPKADHYVLGYDYAFAPSWRLKVEAYYQYLYHIGVELDSNRAFSMSNVASTWQLLRSKPLVAQGRGQNMGMDLTLEKSFYKQYYFLMTASWFDARYSDVTQRWWNGVYNSNYSLTILGGGDVFLRRKKHKVLSFNAKYSLRGGNRYTPIHEAESKRLKREVLMENQFFAAQTPNYWRVDLSLWYQVNRKKHTHTWTFELQNALNHQNIYYQYFDTETYTLQNAYHLGILPNFNYKIEF